MAVCQQNFYHTQKLQKQVHNNGVKLQSYASSNNVWLKSKQLKIKRNCKLEAKFLSLFWVLYLVGKQTYKFKLFKKWKIQNVFYISLLEQNTMRKKQVDDMQLDFEFEVGNNKEYKVEGIWNSAVYARESAG